MTIGLKTMGGLSFMKAMTFREAKADPIRRLWISPCTQGRDNLRKMDCFSKPLPAQVRGEAPPELVKVYEKIRNGVWAFDGVFELRGAWQETGAKRSVFKFKLALLEEAPPIQATPEPDLPHNRLIPTAVKLEVWKRDKGKCVLCGNRDNLHFDHIIPFSQGGSSLLAKNIQLLCAKHNLQKHDKIL